MAAFGLVCEQKVAANSWHWATGPEADAAAGEFSVGFGSARDGST
jgi:hypothetical protein